MALDIFEKSVSYVSGLLVVDFRALAKSSPVVSEQSIR